MNKMNKMNKMNRFLVALLVAIIFGGSFVSCIDSEVSPEIKKIYQGQADLLASQVTVNQAEATLKAAEAKLKEAEATLKKAEADLRAADAEVQKAHAARIASETSSNATAAEVAAAKVRAEVARILAETASNAAAAIAAAEKVRAEVAGIISKTSSDAAAAIAAAEKIRAEVARILAETASNIAAAEVAVNKAEAEIARIVSETASNMTAAEAAAAKVRAEADLEKAKAELEKANAANRAANAADVLAQTAINVARAEFELLKAQQLHADDLRAAGFAVAEGLFDQYIAVRKVAASKLVTRKVRAEMLAEQSRMLAEGKIDSAVAEASLVLLKGLKVAAEVGVQVAKAAKVAHETDEVVTQKAEFDARVKEYDDSIVQVGIKVHLKAINMQLKIEEEAIEVAKLEKLTGTSSLRVNYEFLVSSIDRDSATYNRKVSTKKAKAKKLATYDPELAKLKGAVTTAKANVTAAKNNFSDVPYTNAITKREEYIALDSLSGTTKLRDSLVKTNIYIALPKPDTTALRVERDVAEAEYTKASVANRKNPGLDVNPGPDGQRGNNVNNTMEGITNVTYRIIKDVTFPFVDGVRKKKVTFEAGEFFFDKTATNPNFPIKVRATANAAAVKFTAADIVADFASIVAAQSLSNLGSVGKLYNVEADDTAETVTNADKLVNAAATLVLAGTKLAKRIDELEKYETELVRYKAEKVRLEGLLLPFDDNFKAAKAAFINALKVIGIKTSDTVDKDSILKTSKAMITTKKTSAKASIVGKAEAKKNTAEAKKNAFELESKEDLISEIRILNAEIAALAASLATDSNKARLDLEALNAKIDAAGTTNVEEVNKLVSSINAIRTDIEALEYEMTVLRAKENSLRIIKTEYLNASRLITIPARNLQADIDAAEQNLVTATSNLVSGKKAILNDKINIVAMTELIWVLKQELKVMDDEIIKLIVLANKYKTLAVAALDAATKA